jgi:Family of unknown function (DUF6399)
MTPPQTTPPNDTRQDPFRWERSVPAQVFADFSDPDNPPFSQRHYAQQHSIPRSTLGYWLRRDDPAEADPVAAFFRSPAGEAFLRGIVLAALSTFQLENACGIRPISTFLQRAGLDRFVASSRGALHPLAAWLESDLVAFRDAEQPDLARQMKPRTISLVPDEHFHAGKPCLVAAEPVSNFILVECYRDRRDADTWKEAIIEGTRGMPLEIIQLTSDLARALICCAEKGLQSQHCPDLWHGQRDTFGPLLLPLNRPVQQAEKDLYKAKQHSDRLDEINEGLASVRQERVIATRLEEARQHKDQVAGAVRGIADDFHPFDRQTGKPVTAEEVGKRLNEQVDKMAFVAAASALSEKVTETLKQARTWVTTLMGAVAWFWSVANALVEELELSEEQEREVKEKLLAGHYWSMASGRARTAEERKRLKEMAEGLKKEAWQEGGPLSALPEEARKEVERVAQHGAGLFQRASSCVEGRNGRLSLQHHGHSGVSERRLKALTVVHNYMVKRPDGTTAAERFFGQQHKDVFSWLLERMPDLPRPAPKRRKTAEDGLPLAG